MVAQRYPDVPIAALSTGNVYGMVSCESEGSTESDTLAPDGEYAMAALGRERVFQFFREEYENPICRLRLNYATELRYGVLIDIAQQVQASQPVDVRTSHVNIVWMRDANDMILRSLEHCHSHGVFNVAGPKLSVAHAAREIASVMDRNVSLEGEEGSTALLSDGQHAYEYLGSPKTEVSQMLDWSAKWVQQELPLLGRPTKFHVRDGQF